MPGCSGSWRPRQPAFVRAATCEIPGVLLQHSTSQRRAACCTALWKEGFPRVIEDIPRRLPRPDIPSIARDVDGAIRNLVLPADLTIQELFSWRLLIVACIALAIVSELISVATRTATRLKDARAGRPSKSGGGDAQQLGPGMPDVPKTAAAAGELQKSRAYYRNEIRAERTRGLRWLAFATAIAVWCTGILVKDNALAP